MLCPCLCFSSQCLSSIVWQREMLPSPGAVAVFPPTGLPLTIIITHMRCIFDPHISRRGSQPFFQQLSIKMPAVRTTGARVLFKTTATLFGEAFSSLNFFACRRVGRAAWRRRPRITQSHWPMATSNWRCTFARTHFCGQSMSDPSCAQKNTKALIMLELCARTPLWR